MAETKTNQRPKVPTVAGNAPVSVSDPRFGNLTPARQQEVISAELFGKAANMDYEYSEYGKKCALNAIVYAQSFLREKGKTLTDIDLDLFLASLHNIAVTEINPATIPSEAYCDIRGNILIFKPQGVGNERLVRKFGVGIKPETGLHKAWVIREGDDFSLPQFDGLEIIAPTWTPKSLSGKVIAVVYPLEKANGDVEWLMADRSSVIANVVAQVRQNALYAFIAKDEQGKPVYRYGKQVVDIKARDAYYERVNQLAEAAKGDLDKFLANAEIKRYVNPTYTSYGSMEAMIERKMKNNALKQYPKDYESSVIAKAVADMAEDRDDTLDGDAQYVDVSENVIEKVEEETKRPAKGEPVHDFSVDDETGEIVTEPAKPEPKPEKAAPKPTKAEEEPVADELDDLL